MSRPTINAPEGSVTVAQARIVFQRNTADSSDLLTQQAREQSRGVLSDKTQ